MPAKGPQTLEAMAISSLKKGQVFFTKKTSKDMTAISVYYNRKIKTERLLTLNVTSGKTSKIVKVTLMK